MEYEREGADTHGEGVSCGAEGAVDEGAERAGPAEGGEDLAKQDGDVVLVGADRTGRRRRQPRNGCAA